VEIPFLSLDGIHLELSEGVFASITISFARISLHESSNNALSRKDLFNKREEENNVLSIYQYIVIVTRNTKAFNDYANND
jgi:hypothetical protein